MSKYIIDEATLVEIADAIRFKKETTGEIPTTSFANEILSIKGESDALKSLIEGSDFDLEIPSDITSIRTHAFYKYTGLKGVTIPNTVSFIGESAFASSGITRSIILPNIPSIEYRLFYGCKNLQGVTIPNTVTSIADSAFQDCESIPSIKIPSSVNKITNYAFQGMDNCLLFDFSEHTTRPTLGSYAFRYINANAKIVVPADLYDEWVTATNWVSYKDYIVKYYSYTVNSDDTVTITKYNRTDLTTVEIPATIEGKKVIEIGAYAFEGHTELINVVVPENVYVVADYAFANCSYLQRIELPQSAKRFYTKAFQNCISLTDIVIGNECEYVGSSVFENTAFVNNAISTTYETVCLIANDGITKYLIQTYPKLTGTFTIPDNVRLLCGGSAKCRADTIIIPKTVKRINSKAFADNICTRYDFSAYDFVPVLSDADVFRNIKTDAKILVPFALYDEWRIALNWSNFINHITIYTFTFAIYGRQYIARDAMTWREWVNSEYNTDGYRLSSDSDNAGVLVPNSIIDGEYWVADITSTGYVFVQANQTIIPNKSYTAW